MTYAPVHTATFTENVITMPVVTAQRDAKASIVIPCYNEAKRLDQDAFLEFLVGHPNVSFVFVNDGSKDATLDVLLAMKSVRPSQITVVALEQNSGKAEAVRQGLLVAGRTDASLLGYWDADLATPLDAIEEFCRVADRFEDVDVVFGARRQLLGHRIERTLKRRIVSRICASLARVAVRLPVGDTQCGAKLLRNTPRLADALAKPFSTDWLFDVELFSRLSLTSPNRRSSFYEFPLAEWSEIEGSKVSAKAMVRSGLSMLRLIAESRIRRTRSTAVPRANRSPMAA